MTKAKHFKVCQVLEWSEVLDLVVADVDLYQVCECLERSDVLDSVVFEEELCKVCEVF